MDKLKTHLQISWLIPFAFCLVLMISCTNESPSTTNNEIYFHKLDLEEYFSLGDFVLTIPEGTVARQKMIPAPRFLQARFAELGIIPPEMIRITYWYNFETRSIDILKNVQFIDYSHFDSIDQFKMNSELRISFSHKYSDRIENTINGFSDYFGDEIFFRQDYGQMMETNKFLRVGHQTLYIKEFGKRDSEFYIFMNDLLIMHRYEQETACYYNSDSLKNLLLE